MPRHIELGAVMQIDELTKPQQVEDIGSIAGHHDDETVDHIIATLPDKCKHEHQSQKFETDASHGDVLVLLQCLIKPFHSKRRQPDGKPEQQEQFELRVHLRHGEQAGHIHNADHSGRTSKNDQ